MWKDGHFRDGRDPVRVDGELRDDVMPVLAMNCVIAPGQAIGTAGRGRIEEEQQLKRRGLLGPGANQRRGRFGKLQWTCSGLQGG